MFTPYLNYLEYASAVAAGFLRLMKNRHWLKDVFAGMMIGWLSAKPAFLIINGLAAKIQQVQ